MAYRTGAHRTGSDEIECRGLKPADYPAIKQIIAASFSQAVQSNPQVLETLEQEPWYDPAHLLVAVSGGRPVSHVGVRDGLLRCSGVGIPAGLVGAVCTAPDLRGQGIGARLMRASFGEMTRSGLAVSYLHTSAERSGFYSRLGYRKAIIENPRLRLRDLDIDELDWGHQQAAGVETRAATVADAEALDEIYNAQYRHVSGSWSRTVPFWERRLQRQPKLFGAQPTAFSVASGGQPPGDCGESRFGCQGRPQPRMDSCHGLLAYVALLEEETAGTILEWACLPGAEDVAVGLLASTLQKWRNQGIRTVDLTLPSCHPLRPRLSCLDCEDQTGHSEIWVRLQDHASFVSAIAPLLDERARAAGLSVEIRFPDSGGTLEIGVGKRLQLDIHASDLFSLVYNGLRLPGLLEEGGISLTPDDGAVLARLFPDTGATRCAQDAY